MFDNIRNKKMKRIALDIPLRNHMEIKLAATYAGLTIKEFVEKALTEYAKILNKKQEKTNDL